MSQTYSKTTLPESIGDGEIVAADESLQHVGKVNQMITKAGPSSVNTCLFTVDETKKLAFLYYIYIYIYNSRVSS